MNIYQYAGGMILDDNCEFVAYRPGWDEATMRELMRTEVGFDEPTWVYAKLGRYSRPVCVTLIEAADGGEALLNAEYVEWGAEA